MNDQKFDIEDLQHLEAEQSEGVQFIWTACVPREENLYSRYVL